MNDEDLEIAKKIRNKRKDVKRQKAKETDEFDSLLEKYKTKVLKRLKGPSGKAAEDGHAFEEIEMSD